MTTITRTTFIMFCAAITLGGFSAESYAAKKTPVISATAFQTVGIDTGFHYVVHPDGKWKRVQAFIEDGNRKGMLTAAQLTTFKKELTDTGLFTAKSDDLPDGTPFVQITAKFDGKTASLRLKRDSEFTKKIIKIFDELKPQRP